MAEAKQRLGKLPCTSCGEPTMVQANAAGTLSMACQDCGWSCFAKKGEQANAAMLKKLPKPAGGDPAPAPAAPAGRKAAEPFSLANL